MYDEHLYFDKQSTPLCVFYAYESGKRMNFLTKRWECSKNNAMYLESE